ncbi:MAG: hypothetical protein IJK40_05580 [Clostridia bacterium]|nr:hypothetical protein [Clostridia bacterium]
MEACCFSQIKTSDTVRFVGGGALSDVTAQIIADVTGKTIETVSDPQNAGAVGAAVTLAVGLGEIKGFADAKRLIPALKTFKPNAENKAVYDKQFAVFKSLYKSNKDNFKAMNAG